MLSDQNGPIVVSKLPTTMANTILSKPGFIKLSNSTSSGGHNIIIKRKHSNSDHPQTSPNQKVRIVDPSCLYKLQQSSNHNGKMKLVPVSKGHQNGPGQLQQPKTIVSASQKPKNMGTYQLKQLLMNNRGNATIVNPKSSGVSITPKSVRMNTDKLRFTQLPAVPNLIPQNSTFPGNNQLTIEGMPLPPPPSLTPAPNANLSSVNSRVTSPSFPVISPQPSSEDTSEFTVFPIPSKNV